MSWSSQFSPLGPQITTGAEALLYILRESKSEQIAMMSTCKINRKPDEVKCCSPTATLSLKCSRTGWLAVLMGCLC